MTRSSTRPRRSSGTQAQRAPRSRPTTPTSSRHSRRPSATSSWRTRTRRFATRAVRAPLAALERRRGRRECGLALVARSRRSPSCWAATESSCTPRTPRGRPTCTSSSLRPSRSPATPQQLQDFGIRYPARMRLVERRTHSGRRGAQDPWARRDRTQAGQAAGDVASALAALHTGSARTALPLGTVPRALDEAVAIARFLTASVLEAWSSAASASSSGPARRQPTPDVLAMGRCGLPQCAQVVGAVRDLRRRRRARS